MNDNVKSIIVKRMSGCMGGASLFKYGGAFKVCGLDTQGFLMSGGRLSPWSVVSLLPGLHLSGGGEEMMLGSMLSVRSRGPDSSLRVSILVYEGMVCCWRSNGGLSSSRTRGGIILVEDVFDKRHIGNKH